MLLMSERLILAIFWLGWAGSVSVEVLSERVRIVTSKLASRRALRIAGPMLPVAPTRATLLMLMVVLVVIVGVEIGCVLDVVLL